jgi:hypothetical protein
MPAAMLYATLICSDPACGEEFEAWGELEDLDALVCDSCACVLQPLAFCEVEVTTVRAQLRDAA